MNHDDEPAWDAMYAERAAVWSGEPNPQLVSEASSLSPGKALDVGCGEGADAIWLAQRGWSVTAVDISSVALDRARNHAKSSGAKINFVRADLVTNPPDPRSYDLVSAQFFHISDPPRTTLVQSLGEAVSPGGRLLVVGHQFDDMEDDEEHAHMRDRIHTVDEIIAMFPRAGWSVEVSETRERRGMHHAEMTDMVDTVVMLRRGNGLLLPPASTKE